MSSCSGFPLPPGMRPTFCAGPRRARRKNPRCGTLFRPVWKRRWANWKSASLPFVERSIGTIRRECSDQLLFWTATDLEIKLIAFRDFYDKHRTHSGLKGATPSETREATVDWPCECATQPAAAFSMLFLCASFNPYPHIIPFWCSHWFSRRVRILGIRKSATQIF
jgi:Integrase core domain